MATIPNNQKILTSAPEVNTTYGGPASLQALNTWYTMEDIANTVRPYKVYTALLTQSGGDDPLTLSSGAVTKGVTYYITDASDGDFSNVGAPSNDDSTWFVAINDEVPNNYGSALLRYNTGAPVVTVLENTIGDIWFTYSGTGQCSINSDGLFILNKTVFFGSTSGLGDDVIIFGQLDNLPNLIGVQVVSSTITPADNYGSPIEIRVYN
jgi:hypothetical protein